MLDLYNEGIYSYYQTFLVVIAAVRLVSEEPQDSGSGCFLTFVDGPRVHNYDRFSLNEIGNIEMASSLMGSFSSLVVLLQRCVPSVFGSDSVLAVSPSNCT